MSELKPATTAKLFRNGRSQAVRLPKEFRFQGDAVQIRRVQEGVLLTPIHCTSRAIDVDRWFAELDQMLAHGEFMPAGREQPPMPDEEFIL